MLATTYYYYRASSSKKLKSPSRDEREERNLEAETEEVEKDIDPAYEEKLLKLPSTLNALIASFDPRLHTPALTFRNAAILSTTSLALQTLEI